MKIRPAMEEGRLRQSWRGRPPEVSCLTTAESERGGEQQGGDAKQQGGLARA
jgi:hypothetical protein